VKPRLSGVVRSKCGFVQHLDEGAAVIDALNEVNAIDHRPGRCNHEDVAGASAKCVDALLELE